MNFDAIKKAYKSFTPEIQATFERTQRASRWTYPYGLGFDFMSDFTPIEFYTWKAIRSYGKAPFYPQYPVGGYFLDFGNPIVKVGIECDGKMYHTDRDRDEKRDTHLRSLGWDIYRISGSDCKRIIELPEGEEEDSRYPQRFDYMLTTIEGLIESISLVYFGNQLFGDPNEITTLVSKCLRQRLSIHSNDFDQLLSNATQSYFNRYENV